MRGRFVTPPQTFLVMGPFNKIARQRLGYSKGMGAEFLNYDIYLLL